MSSALGDISCTPANPGIGDSVLVQVKPAAGDKFDPIFEQTIRISGVPGTHTYLQFLAPGETNILVQANGPSGVDSKSVAIDVKPLDVPVSGIPTGLGTGTPESLRLWPTVGLPFLQMHHELHQPGVVGFSVGQFDVPMSQPQNASLKLVRLSHIPPLELPPPDVEHTYQWNFGDGSTFASMKPLMQHDYSNSLNPLVEHQSFDVSVSSNGRQVTRTLTFTNLYSMLKRTQNTLHPEAKPIGFATKTSGGFEGTFTIYNPESTPIYLRTRHFVPLSSNSSAPVTPSPIENLQGGNIIAPGKTNTLRVFPRFDQVPSDSIGFSVYYSGLAAGGLQVRVNVHFDLAPNQQPRAKFRLWEGSSRTLLDSIRDMLIRHNLKGATTSQLQALEHPEGVFAGRENLSNDMHMLRTGILIPGAEKPPNAVLPPHLHQLPGSRFPSTSLPFPGELKLDGNVVAIGAECDPDNLPEAVPTGFLCQATTEIAVHQTQARFRNAWKGHTVLAPGV